MKTDFSKLPREEVEARITTMLMGEMSSDEAAELMDFVSRNAELLKLHEELKRTISLVEEATAGVDELKLSEGRREAVLQQFKVIPARELEPVSGSEHARRSWLALAAMIAFLFVVSGLMLPALSKSKSKAMAYRARGGDRSELLQLNLPESKFKEEPEWIGTLEQQRERLQEGEVQRAPSAPSKSGPIAVRGRSDVAVDAALPKGKAAALREEMAKVEQALNNAPQTKIELPGADLSDSAIKLKNENWAFQAGQARGFGGFGGGGAVENKPQFTSSELGVADANSVAQRPIPNPVFTFGGAQVNHQPRGVGVEDAEGKTTTLAVIPETSAAVSAGNVVAGKNLTLAYGDRFAVAPTEPAAQSVNGAANRPADTQAFFESRNVAESKKDVRGSIDALAELKITAASPSSSTIDPITGLPSAPAASAVSNEGAERDGKISVSGQVGLMTPEQMKKYFPQTSSEMQRRAVVGVNSSGGLAGAPGLATATLADNDEDALVKRYGAKPAETPPSVATKPGLGLQGGTAPAGYDSNARLPSLAAPAKPTPAKQIAMGREPNPVAVETDAAQRKEIRDVAKKSELARVSGSVSVDKSRALAAEELGRGESVALQQKSLDEGLEVAGPNERAAELRLKLNEPVAAGRQLTESGAAEKNVKETAERELLRRDMAPQRPAAPAAIPQPEISTAENAFSTFSLNVSDVSFKLAAASLEKGLMPDAATVRSEEFINAFDYRDPEPQGAPIGFVWERARYPFAQGRDLLRFSVKTAASGRQAGKPLNLVLLLDSSGSMERADRVRILQECLKTLAAQLRPEDKVSVVAFARTARLWIDGLPGSQANELAQRVGNLNPEGGTNLEEAMKVAYETARKHFNAEGVNRVVLLTDGAANLGDVEPESLKRKVESERKKGVALDCFGIGWEGLNDELLETLSRNGDGRYGFVNTPEAAASEFAGQLAGALNVAASDVKVQVEWNPKRVMTFRQIGYAKHQLRKEQFRDNTVDAAEIGAAEAGNALYVVQVNAAGEGPLGTVRVRFKVPGTNDYREHAWPLNYEGASKALENADYTLRLAGTASAFSEWLVSSPYAAEVTTDKLLTILSGVPEHFAPDTRPMKLEWMIRQAKSLAGK